MAARRAAAVLALALAAHAKEFDMGGQCAAVFKEQKWIAEDADGVRSHQWDYKIIVSPWTVFGKARAAAAAASCAAVHGSAPRRSLRAPPLTPPRARTPPQVSFRLEGTGIVIRDVYQAQADETGYASTRVTLDAHGSGTGLNIFEVSGSGDVKAGPHLSCSGLVSPDELSHCPLGAPPLPRERGRRTATAHAARRPT